jgi:hypothetical protein
VRLHVCHIYGTVTNPRHSLSPAQLNADCTATSQCHLGIPHCIMIHETHDTRLSRPMRHDPVASQSQPQPDQRDSIPRRNPLSTANSDMQDGYNTAITLVKLSLEGNRMSMIQMLL